MMPPDAGGISSTVVRTRQNKGPPRWGREGASGRRNTERRTKRSFDSCIAVRCSGAPGGREAYRNLGQGPAISQENARLLFSFFCCLLVTVVEIRTLFGILQRTKFYCQPFAFSLLSFHHFIRPQKVIVSSILRCTCAGSSDTLSRFRSHFFRCNTGHSRSVLLQPGHSFIQPFHSSRF